MSKNIILHKPRYGDMGDSILAGKILIHNKYMWGNEIMNIRMGRVMTYLNYFVR